MYGIIDGNNLIFYYNYLFKTKLGNKIKGIDKYCKWRDTKHSRSCCDIWLYIFFNLLSNMIIMHYFVGDKLAV